MQFRVRYANGDEILVNAPSEADAVAHAAAIAGKDQADPAVVERTK